MIIGIDVDETIVDMRTDWKEWCIQETETHPDFTREIQDLRLLDFWKQADLYKEKRPFQISIDFYNAFKTHFKIVFISHCFPEHEESKKIFIEKHFPGAGFISTKDKHLCDVDYIIDDRDLFFIPFKENNLKTVCILYKTIYKDSGICDYSMNWNEIHEFFRKIKELKEQNV